VQIDAGSTIRSAITSPVKAILSLPENVQATIDGDTVSLDTELFENTSVTFEKQAASKAAKAMKPKGKGGKPKPKGY
jgi:hypothetical protein